LTTRLECTEPDRFPLPDLENMPRFVVLRHELPAGSPRPSHWDVMFETDGTLRTWAIAGEPDSREPQPAEALADHRLEYLSYEGPVSGERGRVARWDAGTYRRAAEIAAIGGRIMGRDDFRFEVAGTRLRGAIELVRRPEGWSYRFVAAPDSPGG
jgi:hypothetical protein